MVASPDGVDLVRSTTRWPVRDPEGAGNRLADLLVEAGGDRNFSYLIGDEDSRLCAVVDWERCRAGDAGFDLVGVCFDVELGPRASQPVRARLDRALRERVPAPALAAYTAIYAARYASWAIGTSMEREVIELGSRLVDA